MKWLRSIAASVRAAVDRRDVLGLTGVILLAYGGETLYPGAGFALAGGVLVAIAVLVH